MASSLILRKNSFIINCAGIRNEFPTLSMMCSSGLLDRICQGWRDTVVNVTDSNDNATDDSKTGSEKSVFADDLDEETDLKEESEYVIGNLKDCVIYINVET